jgi:hypothetical protein
MAAPKNQSSNTGKRSSQAGDIEFTERFNWITLDDFTPGIYSKSDYSGATPGGALPAPHGAAQLNGTYGCIAIPTGGLAPLPGINGQFNIPAPVIQSDLQFGYFNISGFFAFGPVGPPSSSASGIPDDIFIGIEWLDTSGNRNINYYRIRMDTTGAPTDTITTVTTAVAGGSEQYHGMTFAVSRINVNSPYLSPGTPVVVAAWEPPSFPSDKHLWTFPDPSAPGVTGFVELYNSGGQGFGAISGDILGHQGRIVIFEDVTNLFGGSSGDAIPTNEQVTFTDPANSNVFGGTLLIPAYQREVFVQEYPNGFGAWGSMSAGELFVVKQQGGGAIISGDLNSPTVTRLPGVVSTAGMECRAASMPDGLVYFSRFKGAWIWNGSNNSTKISDQLEDDFMFYTGGPDKMVNIALQFEEWGDWVLCSNGYLYDTNTKSWWILDTQSFGGYTPQWYAKSYFGEDMYAIPMHNTVTECTGAIRRYTRGVPTYYYSWTGHPLQASLDRIIDIREVVILAQGVGNVNIVLTAKDGTTQTVLTNANQPQRLRQTIEVSGYNIVPEIFAYTGGGPAPVVYSVNFGCRETQLAVGE